MLPIVIINPGAEGKEGVEFTRVCIEERQVMAGGKSSGGLLSRGVKSEVLRSWLIALNTLRNACAHHGRVWNKMWGTQPQFPLYADQPEWYMTYLDKARKWVRPPAGATPAADALVSHSCSTGTLLYICKVPSLVHCATVPVESTGRESFCGICPPGGWH